MGRKNYRLCAKNSFLKLQKGITLSEVLVVLAIFAILIVLTIFTLNPGLQIGKSRDKRRIADLKKISISLEDYAGDHDCYPERIYITDDQCRAIDSFGYYLKNIPCDPLTRKPYKYIRIDNCKQFVIYATLEFEGVSDYGYGNYYLASNNVREVPTIIISPTPAVAPTSAPLPTPTPAEARYFGCFSGQCQILSGPGQCSPNYIRYDSCFGNECCTFSGVYKCYTEECR